MSKKTDQQLKSSQVAEARQLLQAEEEKRKFAFAKAYEDLCKAHGYQIQGTVQLQVVPRQQ